MTTPKISTFRRGSARWYRNPETGGEYIGVTSVTGLTPRPWLGPWQAKLAAEFAVENIGSIFQMMLDAEKAAVKMGTTYEALAAHQEAEIKKRMREGV